jgi:hypothetical protein
LSDLIEELLAGNRPFIAGDLASHQDYYYALSQAQRPQLLWIGCSASRVSEHLITDSKPGTIFIHRNQERGATAFKPPGSIPRMPGPQAAAGAVPTPTSFADR